MYTCSFSAPVDTLGDWPKDKSPCDPKKIVADVVFIWDGSGALDEQCSAIIYEYILAFLKPFKYGPDAVQAGMVVYEDKVTQTIRFNEAKTFDEFKKLVDGRGPPQGNEDKAGIDDAFRVTLDEILNEANGSRRDVPRLVVFFPTQRYTGPNPAARAALLRQQAELFVVSLDSLWKLSDEQLLDLAGDWSHIYQYNDVNVQDALPATLPLATWRAICEANEHTFFVSFIDDSTEYDEKFNAPGSAQREAKVQQYREKLSSVYQHSALHTSVIDVLSFEQAQNSKTRVLTKTTFSGYTSGLEGKTIEGATEYLAEKQSWKELKATRKQ
jgi:hypothetical protein